MKSEKNDQELLSEVHAIHSALVRADLPSEWSSQALKEKQDEQRRDFLLMK